MIDTEPTTSDSKADGSTPAPQPRTSLVSSRRLAQLFPPATTSEPSGPLPWLRRLEIWFRVRLRLLWARAHFRARGLLALRPTLVQWRMRLRLALLRWKHRHRLRR